MSGYPSDWNSRRRRVYSRDGYRCQNCGAGGGREGGAELHAHHIVPISKGGSHSTSNLKTMCKECHGAIHGRGMAPTASSSSTDASSEGAWLGVVLAGSFYVAVALPVLAWLGWVSGGLLAAVTLPVVMTAIMGFLIVASEDSDSL